jgi:hypothetical protein
MVTALAVHTRSKWLDPFRRFHRWLEYRVFLRSQDRDTRITSPDETDINNQFNDGPSNHQYSIHGGKLVPSFQLYERWRTLAPVPSEQADTFVDIGCCYGYYVLQVAQQAGCRLAVGVDVHEPFISTAERAGRLLQLPNVAFHRAVLDDIASRPAHYGGPFRVAFLLGTYHYIFWGSARSSHCFRSHEQILACLSELVTGCIVFSARLELNHLPNGVRQRAYSSPEARVYSTASFLRAAESFFDVEHVGFLGSYPLFVMRKKASAPVEPPDAGADVSLARQRKPIAGTIMTTGVRKTLGERIEATTDC